MSPADPLFTALEDWIEIFHSHTSRLLFRFARERGLSMSQLGALFHIQRAAGSGVTDLGEVLGVTSAAASQMLERLVQQGLVLRSEDPADRRGKHLVLTDQGQQTLQESFLARQGWLDELAISFSPAEKEQVVAALKLLIEKARLLESQTGSGK